jgi:hypothetical protein
VFGSDTWENFVTILCVFFLFFGQFFSFFWGANAIEWCHTNATERQQEGYEDTTCVLPHTAGQAALESDGDGVRE